MQRVYTVIVDDGGSGGDVAPVDGTNIACSSQHVHAHVCVCALLEIHLPTLPRARARLCVCVCVEAALWNFCGRNLQRPLAKERELVKRKGS